MNKKPIPPVSTRLSPQESMRLDEIVEHRGTNRSETLKHCFNEYLEQQSLEQRLTELERRLYKAMFANIALGLQLTQDERKLLAKQLREIGIYW